MWQFHIKLKVLNAYWRRHLIGKDNDYVNQFMICSVAKPNKKINIEMIIIFV